MHTVCELAGFRRTATSAGMSEGEIDTLVDYLAQNPMAGDEMSGTGGCRKVRIAGRGKGKSGGYRTVTFYSGEIVPVFLITVFSKGERTNLTHEEKNLLARQTANIKAEYRKRVVRVNVG